MEEDKIKRLKPLQDNPVRVFFRSEFLRDISEKVSVIFISESDFDIGATDAESVFEAGMKIENCEIFLPGEGKITVSGIVKISSGNKCRITYQNQSEEDRDKIARYIEHIEHIGKIHLKTYKSASEVEEGLHLSPQISRKKEPVEPGNTKKKKILIIDDSRSVQEKFGGIFEKNNFEVIRAADGMEGIRKSLEALPDIILMDVNMPRLNGIESVRIIKSNPGTSHIPICMFTTEEERVSVIKAIKAGVKDYIIKTMDPESVFMRIRKILEAE